MIRKYQHVRDKHAYTKLGTEGYESLKTIGIIKVKGPMATSAVTIVNYYTFSRWRSI